MKLSVKNILVVIKNVVVAIFSGKFLLRLKADKYFVHILYTFFILALIIWTSLKTDDALARVKKNNAAIEELQIANSQKTFELVQLSRRTEVSRRLKRMGSDVHENTKPAYRIEK